METTVTITNCSTAAPIPYATVYDNSQGTEGQADGNGQIALYNLAGDQIEVVALGFTPGYFTAPDQDTYTFCLQPLRPTPSGGGGGGGGVY